MNSSTPLLLLSVLIPAAMLIVWMRARRRQAEARSGRAHERAPATPAHVPEHVRHPPPIAPARPAWVGGGRGLESEPVEPAADGAVSTSLMPPPTTGHVRTLTDMLEGLQLPFDLVPVTSVVEDIDRHIIFLTTHQNAAEVGTRFADELERLGFELDSVDFDQAVAVRGDDVISMKIVPNAGQVDLAGSPRYGVAGPGDVALETWIGRSPMPPSAGE